MFSEYVHAGSGKGDEEDEESEGGGSSPRGQSGHHPGSNTSPNHHHQSGLSKKQRKARTAFTDHQLQTLEKSFERQKYLSVQDR